jgi:hypothetical protein
MLLGDGPELVLPVGGAVGEPVPEGDLHRALEALHPLGCGRAGGAGRQGGAGAAALLAACGGAGQSLSQTAAQSAQPVTLTVDMLDLSNIVAKGLEPLWTGEQGVEQAVAALLGPMQRQLDLPRAGS